MMRPYIGKGWDPQSAGIAAIGSEEKLLLHPNPVETQLQIRLPASMQAAVAQMEIHSLSGQRLYQGPYTETFSTAGLPAGIYLIRVTDSRRSLQGKFVVR